MVKEKTNIDTAVSAEGCGQRDENRLKALFKSMKGFREGTLILIIIALSVAMSFMSPYFFTIDNLKATVLSFATEGIVVVGMTVMMIVGGIDLSVGAVMALAMVVSGKLFLLGTPIFIAIIVGLAAAALVGLIMGLFVTRIGLSPFITTLAFMGMARGACFVISQGSPLSLFSMPASFKNIGLGSVAGIPYVILIFLAVVIISDIFLRRGSIMRLVYYTGSNEEAAVFSGINVKAVKVAVFTINSFLAGFAGIIYMSRFSSATPIFGAGLEMTAISASVIGGASLTGGEGTIFGSVLGIALLGIITNAMVLLDVSIYWQDFIKGAILLVAVSLDFITHARKKAA